MENKNTKFCSGCKQTLSIECFSKCKSHKDGLQHRCKGCVKDYRQTNKYKIAHKRYYESIRGILVRRFHNIEERCNNPKHPNYENYGGRGIKNKFKSSVGFAEYVTNILQADPRGLDIDRINVNGHYEPGNIRFVTRKENGSNRRNSK